MNPPPLDDGFVLALEAVSAPLFVHAGERVLHANASMQRLLGFSQQEFQQLQHDEWAKPSFRAALRAYGERALRETGQLPVHEVEAINVYGSSRYLEITATPVQTAGGTLVVTTCQDLSDIRHVQNSLLEVGQVMHQILDNDPVPSFVIDNDHRITHWNVACARLTGIASPEMVGRRDFWRAFYPDERPLLVDLIVDNRIEQEQERLYGGNIRACATNARAYEIEDYFADLGGHGRWIFCTAAPLLNVQGQLVGAIATLLDVTQRRHAEDALKKHKNELEEMVAARTDELLQSHHQLDAFLENASVGIAYTVGAKITRSNNKFVEMFEIEGGTAELSTRSLFASAKARAELLRSVMPRLRAGESLTQETEMCTRRGQRLWVQLIAYASDASHPGAGVWWLLQDRSDVTRAQEQLVLNYLETKKTNARLAEAQSQLLQAEKLASIGQLAAGVAHEINNPVGFVSANLNSLRRHVEPLLALLALYGSVNLADSNPPLHAQIEALKQSADLDFVCEDMPQLLAESDEGLNRVKRIVQDLKDFSRVDHADWQEADLHQGLDSTLNVARHEFKYKADVIRNYGVLPPVRCLAAQLNQVFMNIIVNAAHAIPVKGEIHLTTRCEGDWVCIEIADTGTGMSEAVRRRIFDPFYTTKAVGQGTGLGLSLSFSIVQKHSGRIEVRSTPGEGSSFSVWLPIQGPIEALAVPNNSSP